MAIAVAGGTGGVGKTIVSKLSGKVIILTRSKPEPPSDTNSPEDRKKVQVEYNDISSLSKTLEDHDVHTVISAISIYDGETSQSQLNLIQAADKSNVTTRFIPSEYSFIQTHDLLPIDPSIQHFIDAVQLLQKTNLQYTRVIPGFFMDYWGMNPEKVIQTNLQPSAFGTDIANCEAAIPGDGNDRICMTYSEDMATFVARLLDVKDWPEFSVVVGDEYTYNEIIQLGQELQGKHFKVVYDSHERVKEGKVTVPKMPPGCPYSEDEVYEMTVLVSRLTIAGVFDLPKIGRLNDRFPDISTKKLRDFMRDAWKE
ncbi:NmrA-like family protein [Aspergillus steynii IBT 23096]|uniref:NmrA-like family protein n=1 Tax=Aspergillus steynii IBT 23096 TaxID=1392250 RepID=A0A2I2G3K1_9EURO|nr:NmrA-like family protein [Aspergillus steynii IBT 23096]PLB47427.1 NmrA-like family protein [Aspergillus steynii IBT 23096]